MLEFLLLGLKCGMLGLAAASVFVVGITLLMPLFVTVSVLVNVLVSRLGGADDE